MKVYLAGKITKNGWRHSIFPGLRNFEADNLHGHPYFRPERPMIVDGYEYVGPYFLSDDHGMFHGDGTHGRGVGKNREAMMNQDWSIENARFVVAKCLQWIKQCDKMFVWLDKEDAFGTITEIGYAKALNKPIFFALDSGLKGTKFEQDIWFTVNVSDSFMYADSANQAWDVFIGATKQSEVEKASDAQMKFLTALYKKAGKVPNQNLEDASKDLAGKIIAYFKDGKFKDEVEPIFSEMSGEEKEQFLQEDANLKATEVVAIVKEHFKDVADFTFSHQSHAGYVRKHGAKKRTEWTKTVESIYYNNTTTFYSRSWVSFLIGEIEKNLGVAKS